MSQSAAKPLLVVFEGLDGAGKTTCARALAHAAGAHYMTTPGPELRAVHAGILYSLGNSQEARQLFYMATVFAAAEEARAVMAAGRTVVMDRYFLSTQVYAEARGSGLALDGLGDGLLPATLTVYLDASLPARHARLTERRCTRADRETLDPVMDTRLRELYMQKSALAVAGRFVRIDNSTGTADRVVERVMRELMLPEAGLEVPA